MKTINNIEELIYQRSQERIIKNWKKCDEIRNQLDEQLIFIFDTKEGQDVYYLTYNWFRFKNKSLITLAMSDRQYVEYIIKRDIRANKNFNSWLYTINGSNK